MNIANIFHGKFRTFFAYSFPLLLGALFMAIVFATSNYYAETRQANHQDNLLKQAQIAMAGIRSEFSLSQQIEKELRNIVTDFTRIATTSTSVAMQQLGPIFQSSFSPDLAKNCQTWAFTNQNNAFVALDTPPFMSIKKKAMERAFAALAALQDAAASESFLRRQQRFITGVFGENSAPEYLANDRMGKLTPIIFAGKQHYLYWQKIFIDNNCAGGFISLFDGDYAENRELALKRAAEKIYLETENALTPVFNLSAIIDPGHKPIVPDEIAANAAQYKIIASCLARIKKKPTVYHPRQLLKIAETMVYFDTIADESPYQAFLFINDQADDLRRLFSPWLISAIVFLSWTAFFMLRLQKSALNLGLTFRLLFFMTGMLPVVMLTVFGLEMIEQSCSAEISSRVQKNFKLLDQINEKVENLVAVAELLIKDILNNPNSNRMLASHDRKQRQEGFNSLSRQLKAHEFVISYLLLMPPGQQSEVYAETSANRAQAKYHLEYYAMSLHVLHRIFTKGQKDSLPFLLTDSQKTMFSAFDGDNTSATTNIFLDSNNRVTGFAGGHSHKYLQYSEIISVDGQIKTYLVAGLSMSKSILGLILEQLKYAESHNDNIFVCLNRDIENGQKVYPLTQQKFYASHTGAALRRFLEAASSLNYQLHQQNGNNIFIYEPLLKVKSYYAGAMISIADILQKRDFKKVMLIILIALLGGSIYLLSATVSRLIIEPTSDLAKVFTAIATGDYEQNFCYSYKNELGNLATATSSMVLGLKQRKLLGRFVSKTFDQEIIDSTDRTAAKEMHGVILFSDIRSFTTLSELYPAEQIGLMLNCHLKKMVAIINSHGGHVEQFIGDAIVAFFPGKGESSCRPAIKAAKQMRLQHHIIVAAAAQADDIVYEIGIGLEYGQVMAGTVKTGARSEHVVIGQARAKAEEFEGSSKQGKYTRIIVGRMLIQQLPDIAGNFASHGNDSLELKSLEAEL